MLPPSLLHHLSTLLRQPLQPHQFTAVGGGSINQVFRIALSPSESYCCKINSAAQFPQLFALEAEGLAQLAPHIAVPHVVACSQHENTQILLLQWIETKNPDAAFWKTFGEALAQLHHVKGAYFGNSKNNYMGAVPQSNIEADDWPSFFARQRLMPLIERCIAKNLLTKEDVAAFEKLYNHLSLYFEAVQPSLLHGDLWSGNFLCYTLNKPVLLDPALYYGHPSVDLGMTTLFGGFERPFYEAYNYHAPLPPNYREQWAICNLYPLLIHLLLFGKSYLSGIRQTLQKFAA